MFNLSTYFAIGAIIGAAFFYQYWQMENLQKKVTILTANNTILRFSVDEQKKTVKALGTSVSQAIKSSKRLAKKIADGDGHRQEIVNVLNSYRGRLSHVVLEKPRLIERRATRATANILHQIFEESGNRKSSDTY